MSVMRSIQSFFTTNTETSDEHWDERLKSRYYKSNAKKTLQEVVEVLNAFEGISITSVSEDRGEISASIHKPRKGFLVATVVSVRPFETAVDFNVLTETSLPSDFGNSKRVVYNLYERIDQKLSKSQTGKM
ncbi:MULTISPECIES: hypothetical protein [Bacillus]|uniref:Cytosolic protein n=2 Tax=Bacillus TaxID=1386 RepID=A0A0M4G9E3_9BACI|nr:MULTISPECIES: hypothetical protein [Bacillus]ALC81990.1 cytosolic protein [Bacillus gobiensis]MBP1083327.1 hypothetical protein [Bacillus capparidis]MED1097759.1 cytosolic protein [Bacillus capparidis]